MDEVLPGAARDPMTYLRTFWPHLRIRTKQGQTEWPWGKPPKVTISSDLDEAEQRVTLTHELFHVERGDAEDWQAEAEEGEVIKQTARWLLPEVGVVRAAIRQHGLHGAAELLRVPARVLLMRLRTLTRHESQLMYDEFDGDETAAV
jgi:hypothetical protein